ncbi:hypothetical protein [Thermomonospora amylolytica]|uniref:hypothetical protein n=1 Tax=Thermomonospora amylolytica TaxID=1411117 RepID=UPI00130082C5|nr:hypothetical protein [Thermomonospora amylolytica]
MPTSSAADYRRPLLVGFVFVVLWVIALLGTMTLFSLESHACGLDPLTYYEYPSCAPVSVLTQVCLPAWFAAPWLWLLRAGLPRDRRTVRSWVAVTALTLPVGVVLTVLIAFHLWWPLRPS